MPRSQRDSSALFFLFFLHLCRTIFESHKYSRIIRFSEWDQPWFLDWYYWNRNRVPFGWLLIADPFLHDPLPRIIISPLSATRLRRSRGKKEKEKERMEILRGERGEEGRKRNGGDYTRSFAARRDYSHVTASTLEIHIRLWNECLTPSGMATYNSLRTKYSHG